MKDFRDMSTTAERVVDVAQDLIQRHGYNGFSYDDLSRVLGIKKPSIHHHFATKAELGAVVAQRYTHHFMAMLADIHQRHATAPARLRACVALFVKTYVDDKRLCLCGMLGAEADALPDVVTAQARQFFEQVTLWLAQELDAGRRGGELAFAASSRTQALAFLSALEGAMIVGRCLGSDTVPGDVGRTLVSSLLS
jgi:TetR/AcrR family transcriptional regulator, transcriptional repressor for nem operon